MALSISASRVKGALRLMMSGRFDFNSHKKFRKISEEALKEPGMAPIELDLGKLEYMDSSALGMLLLFKERVEKECRSVSLVNCGGAVKNILKIVNFDKVFKVTWANSA